MAWRLIRDRIHTCPVPSDGFSSMSSWALDALGRCSRYVTKCRGAKAGAVEAERGIVEGPVRCQLSYAIAFDVHFSVWAMMRPFVQVSKRLSPLISAVATVGGGQIDLNAQQVEWKVHSDQVAGFEIPYPGAWRVIVAKPRSGPGTAWELEILLDGELHKTVFYENDNSFWPGQYTVRVLENPDSLDLGAVYSQFDLSDLWDSSAADTTLAGQPVKTWVRWNYDSLGREYLLVRPDRMFHILFDEENGNDPDFVEHYDIFVKMTAGFRLIPRDVR